METVEISITEESEETKDSDVNTNKEEGMDKLMYRQTEASKDDTIKQLKEVESQLIVENLSMKKQIDKLKTANMHKELTNSRRS